MARNKSNKDIIDFEVLLRPIRSEGVYSTNVEPLPERRLVIEGNTVEDKDIKEEFSKYSN